VLGTRLLVPEGARDRYCEDRPGNLPVRIYVAREIGHNRYVVNKLAEKRRNFRT